MLSVDTHYFRHLPNALPGRDQAIATSSVHRVLHTPLKPPFPEHLESIVVAMGCFWGAERRFWSQTGVYSTAVGYAGGTTPNPTYEEVCTGKTGHTEVVLVVFDPNQITLQTLLKVFFTEHNPTEGMRQGNDIGTQYRSAIFAQNLLQLEIAMGMAKAYEARLFTMGLGELTTEIALLDQFYYAEDYHQQYLQRNPNGYCGLRGTGVSFDCRA